MYRLFLSGRYTLVRPVSYLAMVSIGLAVMGLIVVASIMNGFLDETRAVLRGTTADIIVFPDQGDRPQSRERLERIVAAHPDVTGVSSRLVRPAVFKVHGRPASFVGHSGAASISQVLVLGIDARQEIENTDLADYLAGVQMPDLGVGNPEDPFWLPMSLIVDRALVNAGLPRVLMSESLMQGLGLRRGDAIELVTVPDGEAFEGGTIRSSALTFVIAGAFNTGYYKFDEANVYIPRDVFGLWSGTEHELSELYVGVREQPAEGDPRDEIMLDDVKAEIQQSLRTARLACTVETWMDRHRVWLGAVANERQILLFIFGFFLLLVCTITYSVLTMMVQQKVRDIGILSAIGASATGIGTVFAMVGVCIATLGGLFGLGAGVLLATYVNTVKDWIEDVFGIEIFRKDVYAFTDIPVSLNHVDNLLITAGTVVGAMLICLMPAFKAARLDPVDALRHE